MLNACMLILNFQHRLHSSELNSVT